MLNIASRVTAVKGARFEGGRALYFLFHSALSRHDLMSQAALEVCLLGFNLSYIYPSAVLKQSFVL